MRKLRKFLFTGTALLLLSGFLSPVQHGISTAAQAAQTPAFSTKRTSLYENGENEGIYAYTIKNLKKGYTVKWSLSGSGAPYLTLQNATTTVTGKKATNQVYVDTLGSQAAKNKKAVLTARIYNNKGKLVRKISDSFTIKINSSYLQIKTNKITDSLDSLSVNQAYDFDCSISPSNATSKLYWKVTTQSGIDRSSQITSDGIWRPAAEGSYYIQAYTKNSASGRVVSSARIRATVGSSLSGIRQTASDAVTAVFTGNMKGKISLSDFSVNFIAADSSSSASSVSGTPVSLKELSFSEDGRSVIVKTHSSLADKAIYQVSYKGQFVSTFTASAGKPVSGVILTTETPVNTSYNIEYILYDANGIDVTALYKQTVSFQGVVINGSVTSSGALYMSTLGEYASVTMTCYSGGENFTATANILCTIPGSSGIRTVITDSAISPSFEGSASDSSFYLGDTAYFHFQIIDENGNPVSYSYPSYSSLDTSIFTISSDGKLTGKKAGTAVLSLYCTINSKQVHYQTAITVLPRRAPSRLALSETSITMSNAQEEDYKTELTVTAYDQYGVTVGQDAAVAMIQEENNKTILAQYDSSTGKITISPKGAKPGIYTYTLTLSFGGDQVFASFQLVIQDVPAQGFETYTPELNTAIADTSAVTSKEPLCFKVRLAHYINGIFAGYAPIQTAAVQNDQGWYSDDLTEAPSSKAQKIYPLNNQITLTAAYWTNTVSSASFVKKAPAGTYTVTLRYYETGENANTKIQSTKLMVIVK